VLNRAPAGPPVERRRRDSDGRQRRRDTGEDADEPDDEKRRGEHGEDGGRHAQRERRGHTEKDRGVDRSVREDYPGRGADEHGDAREQPGADAEQRKQAPGWKSCRPQDGQRAQAVADGHARDVKYDDDDEHRSSEGERAQPTNELVGPGHEEREDAHQRRVVGRQSAQLLDGRLPGTDDDGARRSNRFDRLDAGQAPPGRDRPGITPGACSAGDRLRVPDDGDSRSRLDSFVGRPRESEDPAVRWRRRLKPGHVLGVGRETNQRDPPVADGDPGERCDDVPRSGVRASRCGVVVQRCAPRGVDIGGESGGLGTGSEDDQGRPDEQRDDGRDHEDGEPVPARPSPDECATVGHRRPPGWRRRGVIVTPPPRSRTETVGLVRPYSR